MALEDTQYWSMRHNADTSSIELGWKDATSAMSVDDFKEALQHFAGHIREEAATGALVDVRRFRFATTADLEPWRLQNIVPAYNHGGLKRFAYLLPVGTQYRPGDGGEQAEFTTDYFEDLDAARTWLKQA
jgi:hypothetical protein